MFLQNVLPIAWQKLTLVILLLIAYSSFVFSQPASIDSSKARTLRLDLQEARGANVSQIFDEVNFIPLETTKESLFGRISMLRILKSHFIVFDYDTRSVLIFNSKGKFISKINGDMVAEGSTDEKEKNQFYGFELLEYNKDSLIAIRSSKHIHLFGLSGKRVAKVLVKDMRVDRGFLLGDSTRVMQNVIQKKGKDSTHYELGIVSKTDTLRYFPYDINRYKKNDEFWDNPKLMSFATGKEMFFVNMYGFDLFRATSAGLNLAYRLIFPANNTLPKDFGSNPIYVRKRGEYFRNNPRVFYRTIFAYQIGDNLFLQFNCWASPTEVKKAIIYNLKTTEMISLQDIQPDSLSHDLPVNDAGKFYEFANQGFHFMQNNYVYTSYSSLAMFTFKEQLGDKRKTFSPLLDEYFKTQNKRSNPVLIQLKPKRN